MLGAVCMFSVQLPALAGAAAAAAHAVHCALGVAPTPRAKSLAWFSPSHSLLMAKAAQPGVAAQAAAAAVAQACQVGGLPHASTGSASVTPQLPPAPRQASGRQS